MNSMRFGKLLYQEIDQLCQRVPESIAANRQPFDTWNEEATLHSARPVFRTRFRTGKSRKRGDSSGLWYVYYTIEDKNRDSEPDTITIYAVRHGASEPFSLDTQDDEAS